MSEVPEETAFLGEFGSRGEEGGAMDTELSDLHTEKRKGGLPRWHSAKHQGSELSSDPILMCDNHKVTSLLWDLSWLTHKLLSSLEHVGRIQ